MKLAHIIKHVNPPSSPDTQQQMNRDELFDIY